MIKQFIKVFFLMLVGIIIWFAYERALWPQDYSQFQAPVLNFGEVDSTYQTKLNRDLFKSAVIHSNSNLKYPQDIAVADDGTVYTGLQDGSLVKILPSGQIITIHKHNDTGMICGIIISQDNMYLYYVTEHQGLVSFDLEEMKPDYLLGKFQGKKIPAPNGVCLDEDKHILYMTDCSTFHLKFTGKDLILKRQSGRIISYNLITRQAKVVLDNLAYPNGIVFDQFSQSIIFSQMTHHSISKLAVYQKNAKKVVLIDNLFGYPDNLKLSDSGDLYVGMPAVRDPSVEHINQNPDLRKKLIYLPDKILEMLRGKVAGGISIDPQTGKIKQYIFGEPKEINVVTTILEKNGKIYFSSLRNPTVVVVNKNKINEQRIQSSEL